MSMKLSFSSIGMYENLQNKKKLVENQMDKFKAMVPVLCCYEIHRLQKHGGAWDGTIVGIQAAKVPL